MSVETFLKERSETKCELCSNTEQLCVYEITPDAQEIIDDCVLLCTTCKNQIEAKEEIDINHWRCLNDSMWSQIPAVQIMAWRILTRIKDEGWPQDLLDMLYLDDELLKKAQSGIENNSQNDAVVHLDSNGAILQAGDTVTLTKDLNVKGANFTAKRGTAVRNISLVADNSEHIEGKVESQRIVILTRFVKKSG